MKLASAVFPIAVLLAAAPVSKSGPQPGAAKALDPDLLLWLPMETGFEDRSANRHSTKIHGDVVIKPGMGAVFDGDGDFIELKGLDLKNKPFAFAFWMKVTGKAVGYGIFQQQSAKQRREWLHFLLREPLTPYLGFYGEDTRGKTQIRNTDGWRHIVCQYADGKASVWIDGKADVSEPKQSFLGDRGHFLIGLTPRWRDVSLSDFEGQLRDFRAYQRALTEFEIAALAARR